MAGASRAANPRRASSAATTSPSARPPVRCPPSPRATIPRAAACSFSTPHGVRRIRPIQTATFAAAKEEPHVTRRGARGARPPAPGAEGGRRREFPETESRLGFLFSLAENFFRLLFPQLEQRASERSGASVCLRVGRRRGSGGRTRTRRKCGAPVRRGGLN